MILGMRKVIMLTCATGLVFTACGGSQESDENGSGGGEASSIKAPAAIADAGELVYCTEGTYPPLTFQEGGEFRGSDIDIGREIANRMGVEVEYVMTAFDALIPSLKSEKCDAIISGLSYTEERAEQVTFTYYSLAPQGLMVPKGNPLGIEQVPEDLSGKSAAVLTGTNNLDALKEISSDLKAEGKPGVDISVFTRDTDAANALRTGKVDVYAAGLATVTEYVNREPELLEKGPTLEKYIPVPPYGVGTRPEDEELQDALEQAVAAMYADGTAQEILAEHNLSEFALSDEDLEDPESLVEDL